MVLPFRFGFRIGLIVLALLSGAFASYTVFADEIYDRLDGKGPSGKRVDVIEWDGNLEVHVYPKGGAKGLSAKLDDRDQGKNVMVLGYRFSAKDKPLVRRAILGVPFNKNVKGFVDPTEKDFDKLAISNQDLPAPWKPYKLDPSPKQWYPDGDERNDEAAPESKPVLTQQTQPQEGRVPTSVQKKHRPANTDDDASTNDFNF